ncbi:hypothetical protein ATDW_31070 [Asticcacaulis sp. DW145]|uniref:YARHG domain-containing protein n=1 Tax=Asticcacaulis currens TaxID=2984210 RepID=A0ABT5IHB0_9CAUL|nr:hypothetical protein [Asticcacaulis currens]MDC7695260.1 hypothetical protein [Asticcacaulis currens]BEV12611.1 hypothetical protein ATDW_31070 [Asticcacaulis sp. DW145]
MALNRKQTIWLAGAGGALLLAVLIGWAISSSQKETPRMNTEGPGLVLDIDDAPTLDAKKTLRCFVNGEFVGQLTIADCAKKNGVAANALDVGVDESGEMTAAPTASLAPPPVISADKVAPVVVESGEPVAATAPTTGPAGACLRFAGNEWTRLSDGISLNACATLLFDGRCERPGSASYGRWGSQTLRLVPKRVEISDDNKTFRTLLEQGQGCSVK